MGQIIAQLLSEQLIPFVALDVSSARVAVGKKKDVPVYFGDAGGLAGVVGMAGGAALCLGGPALDVGRRNGNTGSKGLRWLG